MPEVVARQATIEDMDILVPLFDAYRQFYRQQSDREAARRFLLERFRFNQSVVFLAGFENVPSGFVQLFPSFSSARLAQVWILNDGPRAPPRRHAANREARRCGRRRTGTGGTDGANSKQHAEPRHRGSSPESDLSAGQRPRGLFGHVTRARNGGTSAGVSGLANVHKLGAFESLTFKGVSKQGIDVYDATFAQGELEFMIAPLGPDGKIQSLLMRPPMP